MTDIIGDITVTGDVKASSSAGLGLYDDGGNGIFVEDGGNVGIGTASPVEPLHIEFTDATGGILGFRLKNKSTGTSSYAGFQITGENGTVDSMLTASPVGSGVMPTGGLLLRTISNHPVSFSTNDIRRMTIDTSGNVGIGTTSPGYKLEVSGTSHVTGEFTAGTKTFLIDHPVNPYDKLLYHAVFEGPEHGLVYRGIVALKDGMATVDINKAAGMTAGTFEALAQDAVVVSLQNQDSFDRLKPGVISGASFDILCENTASTDSVAWVVFATRKDPLVIASDLNDENGRLLVEVDKQEPTAEESALLKKEAVGDNEKVGTSTTQNVDILTKRKGYLIQPECRGETVPTKTIEYVKVSEKEEKEGVE